MSIPKEPEQVMKLRGGSVLGKKTILKSDHFPGCQNKRLYPHIDGAPNYRQADSLHVHGVAIPTIDGIQNVLNHIGAQQIDGKRAQVLWINLREEPVVYINGRPFVLRDVERPFSNLEYTGINRARVEQMEARLKEDLLTEAARYGNKILVTDELPDGQMVDQWEPVSRDSVKTPLEVYEELQEQGYLVDYERVPITDEKSPKELDFDILVHKISQADINAEIIFNCQMGRGRTTTGMVIATLIYLNRIGASGIPRTNSIGKISESSEIVGDNVPSSEDAIRRGEYAVIRSLIRVLEGGVEGKRQVDKVIDKCASMQNLREAIATYRNSIMRQPDEMKKEASLSFFMEYLERYYFLICFTVYIHSEGAALRSSSCDYIGFADWMKARPELYSIIRRLLRRDPMGALGYASLNPSLKKIAESADGRPCEMGVVAALRKGEVLGSQTVLKSDHCPGCQNQNLPERVDGAPNFREVPGFSVYGVANPTIDGIRSVIHRIGSSKDGRPVFWHNMREEPVVYINGKPFVLREVERPYKNMLEYTETEAQGKRGRGRPRKIGKETIRKDKEYLELTEDLAQNRAQWRSKTHTAESLLWGNDKHNHPLASRQYLLLRTACQMDLLLDHIHNGIDRERVERMEARLKEDILREADHYGGAIMVIHETDDGQIFDAWEHVNSEAIQTPLEVFKGLEEDGFPIKYARVPITDGKAPKSSDFDTLAINIASASKDTAFVFNCQMGRGRTTTGTVIACLLKLRIDYGRPIKILVDNITLEEVDGGSSSGDETGGSSAASTSSVTNFRNEKEQSRVFGMNDILLLWKITRLFDNGVECREALDAIIDRCSALQNIRQAVLQYRKVFNQQHVEPRVRRVALNRGAEYLERYFRLIAFAAYLGSEAFDGFCGQGESRMTFKNWLHQRPEVQAMKWSIRLRPGRFFTVPVDGYPVYSMATPTILGAKEMLAYLGAKPKAEGSAAQKVVLTDLREEAIVYINGTPFVLRELNKPVDTLKHVGITGSVVEHMEARLKEDILSEVRQSGGRMLLHREEYSPALNQSSVIGYLENIFADDVKTPAEVYAALKDEGYNIAYRRIPLTREREALASDVDAIQYCIDEIGAETNSLPKDPQPLVGTNLMCTPEEDLPSRASDEEVLRMGDYRDILSLTRVLVYGPKSKADVDIVIERCAGAGHLRDDILYYSKELKKFPDADDEQRACVMDMGIKALK
ncbi:unnamed protein product [Malus baccata var. baccata]